MLKNKQGWIIHFLAWSSSHLWMEQWQIQDACDGVQHRAQLLRCLRFQRPHQRRRLRCFALFYSERCRWRRHHRTSNAATAAASDFQSFCSCKRVSPKHRLCAADNSRRRFASSARLLSRHRAASRRSTRRAAGGEDKRRCRRRIGNTARPQNVVTNVR